MMKASSTLVASVLAASTVALTSSSSAGTHATSSCSTTDQGIPGWINNGAPETVTSKEKFAPRFDGLRFIETLITAHR